MTHSDSDVQKRYIQHSKPSLGKHELESLTEVISSGYVAPGDKNRELAARIENQYKARFVLALNSCTSALHLALIGLGVGPGDHVALSGLVCPSVINPILYVGAEVIFVDVCANDHQLDLEQLKNIHARCPVKVVIVPHRYGNLMDLSEIRDTTIKIIEDGAQSFGARLLSSIEMQGCVGVFSFYATKMISAGCGGALVTNDETIARIADDISDYYRPRLSHDRVRYNYRMPDLNAAMAISQVDRLKDFILKREERAIYYREMLGDEFTIVAPDCTSGSVWYRYVIKVKKKTHQDAILEKSKQEGCGISKIDIVIDSANKNNCKALPVSYAEWESCVSLPIYPELGIEEQNRIISCVRSAV